MVEERKSVLETTKPSDALGRLRARQSGGRSLMLILGVLVILGLAALIGLIINNAASGTLNVPVPAVER